MATRAYRRNSRGQFAGSGGRVTYGKAGGFANASHAAKAANARASAAHRRALQTRVRKSGRIALSVAKDAAVAVGIRVAVSAAVGAALGGGAMTARRGGLQSITRGPRMTPRRRGVYNITTL